MAVTLNTSISWLTASGDDLVMLENLQPNILKPHTRDALVILFLSFSDSTGAKQFLRDVSTIMKSAKTHLAEVKAHNDDPTVLGTVYVGVGLTASGYKQLGEVNIPSDPSFLNGMQGEPQLHDPDVATLELAFQDRNKLHAIVLIGDSGPQSVASMQSTIELKIANAQGVSILSKEVGKGIVNAAKEGIEHFGYVDGRSQPLFFTEDILEEQKKETGTAPRWNPDFPLSQAIVPDPGAPDPSVHFGSYFIFRKLEQDVKAFKNAEVQFAKDLQISEKERAGGLLVGRFEDGTPVTSAAAEAGLPGVVNDFTYSSDLDAGKCPFLGHIRKTNPRGTGGKELEVDERSHLMPRRGQTYGIREDDPNDGQIANKPSKDVGLLFMAFNSDIGNQFEFTQKFWANNAGFPEVPTGHPAPGVDPIIGQLPSGQTRPKMTVARIWGDASSNVTVSAVPQTVTMKGGEYFFMPSLAYLREL
ncbi:Dyp-type peroxidase [Pseudomonas sp. NPDC087336]|uniref:Dyp-type peroxidase n=1 Tax=Pseudomonas sp. NPDC087336 TaxID=3364436 RepID=UPI00381037EF